ncbi:MAG: lamin tail domain-containing protein, partial [Chitinophagaceae bacterium]|nr:lamin tail domain-containing protein [Chitinophagaceae bacterium]
MKNTLLFRKSNALLFWSLAFLFFLNTQLSWGQTYYDMSSGNYSQNFNGITSLPTNFSTVGVLTTGTIPIATRTTTASTTALAVVASGAAVGIDVATSTRLVFLTTGNTANNSAIASDLNLNFTNRIAGNLSYDASTIFNGTGDRVGSLRVYYSLDNSAWTELTGTNLPYVATNNVAGSGSINIALPTALNNQATVKLRFYYHNGNANGTSGSRPRIGIDNLSVTSTPSVVCTPQTINPITASVTKSFGEAHSIATTATSGLTVTYSSSNNSIATVATNGDVTIVGVGGPITLTASQAGNGTTVCAATPVTQSFTVTKATPTISVAPTASGIIYGQTLASSTLTGGIASTTGTFAFTTTSTVPNAGTANQGITFTPDDPSFYNTATGFASVFVDTKALTITANNVNKANGDTLTGGVGSTAFTSSGLVSPQTIGSVTITYGSGAAAGDPDGTYVGQVFPSNATGGTFNSSNYAITYNPGDITVTSTPTLTPATTTLTAFTTTYGTASTAQSVVFTASSLPGAITTSTAPIGYEVSSDGITYGSTASLPSSGGTLYVRLSAAATVLGSYNSQVITLTSGATSATITTAASGNMVSKATPTISVAPSASNITFGETLASSTLTGGTASVVGTFAFTNLATAPNAGTAGQGVTFTPTDTDNYNTATTTTSVTVDKATTTISVAPTASNITYLQTLASSILTGGTASVAGTFAFTTPSTVPNVGTANQGITFTPTDFNNYNSATTTISVTVDKANQTIAAITPATITKAIGDAPYSAATTATSGLTVTYSLVSVPSSGVASIAADGTVTILGLGTATITASQAGDGNFNAATSVTQALTVGYPVIAGWDVTGLSATATATATTFSTNLISTSGANTITRGSGAAASAAANSFRTTGFQNNGIDTSNTDFFQTTLTSTAGNILSLATITANLAGTGTFAASPGVSSQFAYSLNGTTFTLIGSPTVTVGTPASLSIDVSGISALQNVPAGTTVTFRYYASGQTTTGGWGFQSAPSAGTNGLAYTGFFTNTPPTVTTNVATVTSSTSATLNGTVNANGNATTASFNYGTTVTATTPLSGTVTGTSNTATSVVISGLSPNTQYTYNAVASGGLGGTVNGSNVSFFTLANAPSAPVLTNATETTIDVAIGSGDGNPIGTLYAIQLNNGSYVQAGGATLGTIVWQTAAAWGTTTVSNLDCEASQTFTVYAKNGADVVTSGTAASLSTTACTAPSLQADPLGAFGALCINTSGTNSFGLLGLNLTSSITVNSLAGFTFSTDNTTFTNTLTLTPSGGGILETIYVRFTPTLVQSYNGAISITGGGTSGITVMVSASGVNTPVSGVTAGATTGITVTSVTFGATTFTLGCSAVTASGIQYSTDGSFSSSAITNGSSTTLSNLEPNTTYNYRAFATDATGTVTGTPLTFTTAGLSAPTALAANVVDATSFTANWSGVTGATGYRLDVSTSPTFSTPQLATDLFFSEYVEGSSNNKYVEIYNGTGASVDLSQYELGLATNGSSTISYSLMTGTLANGSTIVYRNTGAALTLPGGVTSVVSAAMNFNGDDALVLHRVGADPAIFVDVFGRVGNDPGTAWTSASNSTLDKTLTRKSTVTSGITVSPTGTGAGAFTALEAEWTQSNIDVVSGLGSHTFSPATTNPSFVSGYNNLNVGDVTSWNVNTNLTPSTTYYYRVRATSTNSTSASSNTITVTTCANAPVISGSYCLDATTVSGTSTEANGTAIKVYSGATLIGTTLVTGGIWSLTGVTLAGGAVLNATAQVGSNCESVASAGVTVNAIPTTSAIVGATTACSGSTASYSVTNTAGSTYSWTITGGTQASGTNT